MTSDIITDHANDPATLQAMSRHGITNVPVDSFHYREYRYTNLKDAMAQAERDRSGDASNALLRDSKTEVHVKSAMPKPSIVLQPDQLAVSISCPKCGQLGLAVVEKTFSPTKDTLEFTLVSLPDSFYNRLAKLGPHRIETVCFSCGGLLPPLAYDGAALLAAANATG